MTKINNDNKKNNISSNNKKQVTEKDKMNYVTPKESQNKSVIKTLIAFLVLVLVIGGASVTYSVLSEQYREKEPLNIGNVTDQKITGADESPEKIPAPDFTVLDYDGNEVKLSDYFGKPIVLNFWASWCPPCKAEMPHFNKVYLETKSEVHFLMVNLTDGQRETVAKAKDYIESNEFEFPVFFDTKSVAGSIYQISSIPTTLFIDSEGNVVTGFRGMIDEATLRRSISAAKN